MKTLVCLVYLCVFLFNAGAQSVISGPMVGHTTMRSAKIWVQLDQEADVQIQYGENQQMTSAISTRNRDGNTAEFALTGLEPGNEYSYTILINGQLQKPSTEYSFKTQPFWQFRTDPPSFKMVVGSCTYINEEQYDRPGRPYGRGYEIFTSMAKEQPDVTLWLGDNIYLREADIGDRTGYIHRYTHTRKTPEMQALLQTGSHYAIWDDHDFGPNDHDGSWIHKDWALETFDLFWANPTTGTPDMTGTMTAFQYADIDFFLLDNRYHRTPRNLKNEASEILGREQIEWLIANLLNSRAPFKMVAVGGQVVSDVAKYENHAVFEKERAYLLKRIAEEEIKGVVFLTGDRHHTELSRIQKPEEPVIYDLTVSPLTSKSYSGDDENNTHRVENTLVNTQNYGVLEFSGPRKARQMKISIFDTEGVELWTQTLKSE
ncbi:MAG: alkaline phosphatase D family protein [Salibacteraceae bacterium]